MTQHNNEIDSTSSPTPADLFWQGCYQMNDNNKKVWIVFYGQHNR